MMRLRLPSPTVVVCVLTIGLVIWHAVAFAEKPAESKKQDQVVPSKTDQARTVQDRKAPKPSVAKKELSQATPAASPTAPLVTSQADVVAPPALSVEGPPVLFEEPGLPSPEVQLAAAPPPSEVREEPFLAPPAPATPSLDELPAPLAAEAIEEILRLRRAISAAAPGDGGKAGSGLAPDDQFRQALLSLTGQPTALPLVAPTTPPQSTPAGPTEAEAREVGTRPETGEREVGPEHRPRTFPPVGGSDETSPDPVDDAGDLALVATLRDTSRLLDNRAHDYDALQRFDEAERLRSLAVRLRKDARRIESTALARDAARAPSY